MDFTPKCLLCQSPVKPIKLTDFGPVFGPPLGSGAYGTVKKHKSERYGAVAIKTVIPPANKPIVELEPSVIREIAALVALFPHPNIIGVYGFDLAPNGDASIVLECGLMSLSDAIKQAKVGGDNDRSRSVMGQLFRATRYMHQQDIWHRDIKPANVIITQLEPIKVKLADFGLARSGPFCGVTPTQVMYTLWYRPPEILINEVLGGDKTVSVYDDAAEMWALGIVYWELLSAGITDKNITKLLRATTDPTPMIQLLTIFRVFGFNDQSLKNSLAKRYWPFGSITSPNTDVMKSVMTPKTWSVLERMLKVEPKQRISLDELLEVPAEGTKGTKAKQDEIMHLSRHCIAGLPGKNYQEQLLTFTRTVHKMLKFVIDNKMIKDLATFFIAMQLFGCVISAPDQRRIVPIEVQGLLCANLAGKYYSRRRTNMEDVLVALHSYGGIPIADVSELTRTEISIFHQSHGGLHNPNCFRFMVEMFDGCGDDNSNNSNAKLFAWAYCVMCIAVMTKAVFVGKPSDIAKLAINIAAHYLKVNVPQSVPNAVMTPKEIVQGAKLVHGTLITLPATERNAIISLVLGVAKDMLRVASIITPDQFMEMLQGRLAAPVVDVIEDREDREDREDTESDDNAAIGVKRAKIDEFEFSV